MNRSLLLGLGSDAEERERYSRGATGQPKGIKNCKAEEVKVNIKSTTEGKGKGTYEEEYERGEEVGRRVKANRESPWEELISKRCNWRHSDRCRDGDHGDGKDSSWPTDAFRLCVLVSPSSPCPHIQSISRAHSLALQIRYFGTWMPFRWVLLSCFFFFYPSFPPRCR